MQCFQAIEARKKHAWLDKDPSEALAPVVVGLADAENYGKSAAGNTMFEERVKLRFVDVPSQNVQGF